MKHTLAFFLIFSASVILGQQSLTFVQYTFNKAGVNPAASGTDIQQEYYFSFGIIRPWTGFEYAPKQHFANFSYTIRPPRSFKFWQNVGFYTEHDDSGLLNFVAGYFNYTLHFLVRKKTVCSFGIYGGVKRFARNTGGFDNNDPAVMNSNTSVLLYPDLIPGFRISNNKFFLDLSARHLTTPSLKNLNGKEVGTNSRLLPVISADFGRKIPVNDYLLMMPSVALNMPVGGLPAVDATLMFYYFSRLGLGAAIRNISYGSAIIQVRFLRNMTAGFAYSYPFSKMRYASPNSFEFMMGISPFGMTEKFIGKHSVSRCPSLSY